MKNKFPTFVMEFFVSPSPHVRSEFKLDVSFPLHTVHTFVRVFINFGLQLSQSFLWMTLRDVGM